MPSWRGAGVDGHMMSPSWVACAPGARSVGPGRTRTPRKMRAAKTIAAGGDLGEDRIEEGKAGDGGCGDGPLDPRRLVYAPVEWDLGGRHRRYHNEESLDPHADVDQDGRDDNARDRARPLHSEEKRRNDEASDERPPEEERIRACGKGREPLDVLRLTAIGCREVVA